jgi:hypothetical protein
LCLSLATNLANKHISKIHLIQPISGETAEVIDSTSSLLNRLSRTINQTLLDQRMHFSIDTLRDRIELVGTTTNTASKRLVLSEVFFYASTYLRGAVVMFANLDIHFDDTLVLIRSPKSDLSLVRSYFLSRYELPEYEEQSTIGTQCGPKFIGSHDTIIFVPPLPRPLIERCQFQLGSWGIEARTMWEFEQVRFATIALTSCI